jgi:phosphatidylserine/phosphatidylglycerophosphate/cardiolipin synthase-like enzyme
MATKKSRSKKRRKTSRKKQTGSGRSFSTIAVAIVLLFAVGYFLITGSDPLGLFKPIEVTPTVPTDIGDGDSDWWQVYFTDPVNRNNPDDLSGTAAEKLIDNINSAQSSIHIAAFEFNLTPVAQALIAAHQRGVEVLWVTDDENGIEADGEEGHGQFAMLEKAGIPVKDDGRSALMHNKFWIFDDQKVWTGSTNITINGMFQNNNNVLVINSPRVAAMYGREFDEMWAGEFGPSSPSTVDSQQTTINGIPVQVLFAAEDEVIDKLIPLIQNAQHSIRFMAFSFTHDALGQAVLDRAKAGVEVKGIFETRGSETEFSQLSPLYCAGVPVRQDGNPRTFHHKVFVIDDNILITGSLNFSNNANDSNDENVVIVTNADMAAPYLQEFDRRWAEATEPEQADMNCR